jgi:flagellar P-ring protein precursor FlgI
MKSNRFARLWCGVLYAMLGVAVCAGLSCPAGAATPGADGVVRLKDLGKLKGWRENTLVGYGIVTGLAGSGDSPTNKTTRQTIANVLSQFNVSITPDQVQSRNVAVVMVSASLPAFAREGDNVDVLVTSMGDARSLVGGSLLVTPLKAPNGVVYALAQGPLSVGGYRYDMNGNVVQKNHPTTGMIPDGATVEKGVSTSMMAADGSVTFVLAEPDYTTADRLSTALNEAFGRPLAQPKDAEGIRIEVPPENRDNLVRFIAQVENVWVKPDRRARVVINERTGTVVSGGDVTLSKVAIAHGDLKISIVTDNEVSQPFAIGGYLPGARTAVVSNSRISVEEPAGGTFIAAQHNTVADLVEALNRVKTNTRDIIAILQAVKAAGALHAELIIQ